jgi:hypothetical protein
VTRDAVAAAELSAAMAGGDFAEANYPVDSGNIDSLTISAMPMAGE